MIRCDKIDGAWVLESKLDDDKVRLTIQEGAEQFSVTTKTGRGYLIFDDDPDYGPECHILRNRWWSLKVLVEFQ